MVVERDPRDGRPAVVGVGQVVELTGVKPQADTLEGAVTQASAASGNVIPVGPLAKLTEALKSDITYLAHLGADYNKPAIGPGSLPTEPYAPLLLDAMLLLESRGASMVFRVSSTATSRSLVDAMAASYGPQVYDSGIMGALDADMDRPLGREQLVQCFPESGTFSPLLNEAYVFNDNPYLMLFTMPSHARTFLAGVMQLAESKGGLQIHNDARGAAHTLREAQKALSTGYMVQYANQVKERDIKKYLDAVASLNVKQS